VGFGVELVPLLNEAEIKDIHEIDGRTYYEGSLSGNDVVIVVTGPGLSNAAATTTALVELFDVSGIVFSGTAGGISPTIEIGDVVVPRRWRQANGQGDFDQAWFPVDSAMLSVAAKVAHSVALENCTIQKICTDTIPKIVVGGSGVSNPTFVDDPAYRDWLWEDFSADVVDMDSSPIAYVAHQYDLPYLVIRSVSDLAGGGEGLNQVNTFMRLAARNAAAFSFAFLTAWAEREPLS
jgi:adenosylhomocysteine nucleosidase